METHWDDFHFVYFCGYALWQYFNFPYLLARSDVETRELEPHHENGQNWRALEVSFPDPFAFASHAKTQTYYFDDRIVLQRHNYAPDVLGGSPAAHYSYDEVVVGGLRFPTVRRVVAMVPGDGGGLVPMLHGPVPTLIHLVFLKIELKMGGDGQTEGDDTWALTEAPVVS